MSFFRRSGYVSSRFPTQPSEFIITDVGSTTTKAILFRREEGQWRSYRREAPTTVEAPDADVTVGIARAFESLEKATGAALMVDGKPVVPYLSTSSAGGGLAMVVTGLVRHVTSRSAERVALGAGSILLDVIAMDDGRTPYEKIQALKELRPDMVLLAGGFDGDALSGPVFLGELIRESGLKPKLNPKAKLPVVYAGNKNAVSFVKENLDKTFMFHDVPNIRPTAERENLEPAHDAIHELFMNHVMSQAPGYDKLTAWVDAPVVPTPSAFGKILALVSKELSIKILAIDIGGATTDVFTAINGEVNRTVSANLGMSYSLLNVVKTAGIDDVRFGLERNIPRRELNDLLGNKFIRPTSLATNESELRSEWAAASTAVREAVKDHLRVIAGVTLSRGTEDLKIKRAFISNAKKQVETKGTFSLRNYDFVIGSGGILSHSPREVAAMILINALHPSEPVTLAVDNEFIFPHLGVLSESCPELAVELWQQLGMVKLGTFLPAYQGEAATGDVEVKGVVKGGTTEAGSGRSIEAKVPAHSVQAIGLGKDETAEIKYSRGLAKQTKVTCSGGVCGLLVDTRPLPNLPDRSGAGDEMAIPKMNHSMFPESPEPPVRELNTTTREQIYHGELLLRRELAIPGQVFVRERERVKTDSVIARSNRQFLRPFYLNVVDALRIGPKELMPYMLVKPGVELEIGDLIAQRKVNMFLKKDYFSPVAGTFERMLPSGTLVVRERPEDAKQFSAISVAKDLQIPLENIKPYLKINEGDEVERGQMVAAKLDSNNFRYSRSPARGRVKEINLSFGIISIEPLLEELEICAWLPGEVMNVTEFGCMVRNKGIQLDGIWGRGGETAGELSFGDIGAGKVMVRETVTADEMLQMDEANVAGLITGSLHLLDLEALNPHFSTVLTEGFGETPLAREWHKLLKAHEGKLALVDGTTEMRVGVRRPMVLLPNMNS
jgi:uncharacterized protein (TIGR01319 family)